MLKLVTIAFSYLILSSHLCAQSGWVQQISNTSSTLKSARFRNVLTGFCTGDSGTVLKTTNSGVNWMRLNIPFSGTLNSICLIDSLNVFVCGSGGFVSRSTDNGSSWITLTSGTNIDFYSVFLLSSLTGFVSGNGGTILKTTNGGSSFFLVSSGTTGSIRSVSFASLQTGYACGHNLFIQTVNAGQSWQNLGPFNLHLNSVSVLSNNQGFVVGRDDILPYALVPCINIHITPGMIDFYSDTTCGDTYSVHTISTTNMWKTGLNSRINLNYVYKTFDAGVTWYPDTTIAGYSLLDIRFANSSTGWIVGTSGLILKTTTGGNLLGVTQTTFNTPDKYTLSQNYPNPFNPTTKIMFEVPLNKGGERGLSVKLVIYDILGREVATLVNEQLKPGTYEADWDASNFASGIYFYSLQTNEFTQTKKMVLMK